MTPTPEAGPRRWPVSPRPYARWWWFNQPLDLEAIRRQLEWAAAHGFGGVEIAWIYPIGVRPLLGPRWLSEEWSDIVAETKRLADRIGLGCDFTFGSLWPFCGSFLEERDTHQRFEGYSELSVSRTWEIEPVPLLDHLSEPALRRYAAKVGPALAGAIGGSTSALFCDSWEVSTRRMWSAGLWEEFEAAFGYDLRPHIDALDDQLDIRYDYRKFIADKVTSAFYRPFTAICRELGGVSRVQCHGSPTDLLAAYASVDVPESEALLFEPRFSRIPASAAALSGKPVVSAETFTCLYGFPDAHIGRESLPALKLLADAVIAQGVNQIVWHGMPYNDPARRGEVTRFFATTHLGPDADFAANLPAFNAYLAALCEVMQVGHTYSQLALYLPLEDNRMLGEIPRHLRTPAAQNFWELRHVVPPEETLGHHPLWISEPFLREADVRDGVMYVGLARFDALYVDVEWMDAGALSAILRLARLGLPIVWRRDPKPTGHRKSPAFGADLAALKALKCVRRKLSALGRAPLIEGRDLPACWARRAGETLFLFLAHPAAKSVRYPMRYDQASEAEEARAKLRVNFAGVRHRIDARFGVGESLLYEIDRGGARKIDLPSPFAGLQGS